MKKFFPGDRVVYIGEAHHELKSKLGQVCSHIQNNPDAVVVDFGDDSFVIKISNLSRFKSSKNGSDPEFQERRKRYDEGDEEFFKKGK